MKAAIKNEPNILSVIRLCLVPVFLIVFFEYDKKYALAVYVIASITDVLDGFLARKLNAQSNVGRILDPLGDKLMAIAVISCLTVSGILPLWVLLFFLVKDALMILGGVIIHKHYGMEMPSSNFLGKAASAILFIVCSLMMIFPGRIGEEAIMIAVAVAAAAFVSYLFTFRNVTKAGNSSENARG